MKTYLLTFLLFCCGITFGQEKHKQDSVISYGELVQINEYDSINRTIYLKQRRTKFNKKQEGQYQHFDSIKCLECYNSYGEKIDYVFNNDANLYSYYGTDTADIFFNLLPVKEWKIYDSIGEIEKIITYDSAVRIVRGVYCNKTFIDNSSMPCMGTIRDEYVPKTITYYHKGIKYREEYYENGLIIKSLNWKKVN